MFSILIICGGLGTRLYPITKNLPKSLIEINNRPFIYWQLKYIEQQGFKDIHLCLGNMGEMVEEAVKKFKLINLNITFSYDGDKLLGTGGAIVNALSNVTDDLFIQYGDSYLPVNYKKIQNSYLSNDKKILMSIIKNNNKWDKSNVIYKDSKLLEYNKKNYSDNMEYIDYGLSIVSKTIFESYNQKETIDLADIFQKASINSQIIGYEVSEKFYEIGSKEGIKDFKEYLNLKGND